MKKGKKIWGKSIVFLLTVFSLAFAPPEAGFPWNPVQTAEAAARLNRSSLTMMAGTTYQLKVYGGEQAAWNSRKKSVAVVDGNGRVTAKKEGVANITATVGTKVYTCRVTVEPSRLNKPTLTMPAGNSYQLKVSGAGQVAWESRKKSVAIVDSGGKVTAKKEGVANITATVGGKVYTCRVTVEPSVLNKTTLTMTAGKTYQLKVSGGKKATWNSRKKSVALVDQKGKITAKKEGVANITATVGTKTYTCKVTVKPAPKPIDPARQAAFNKLKKYISANGVYDGDGDKCITYMGNSNGILYMWWISYEEPKNHVWFVFAMESENELAQMQFWCNEESVYVDPYFEYTQKDGYPSFSSYAHVKISTYTGPNSVEFHEHTGTNVISRSEVNEFSNDAFAFTLEGSEEFLLKPHVGIRLRDLGFTSFTGLE